MAAEPQEAGQSWEARYEVARDVFVPWVDRAYPLAGKTVLEYGCGTGSVACAFAERSGRHIGYDIDDEGLEEADGYVRRRGLTNVALHSTNATDIFDEVRQHAGQIDVFLLYAVLEHLTVGERLAALRLARDVVRPEGVIAVIETPNRLIDFDFHTSQLPFFDQLPDELALAYAEHSPRPWFRDEMLAARQGDADGGALALARWGRGMSFHEFEIVFGALRERVIAGGYDQDLLAERYVYIEERGLARQLERVRPDLPPPFSRYWLDLLISPRPVTPAPPMIRPWTLAAPPESRVGATSWDTLELPRRRKLPFVLPEPTGRLLCVVGSPAREVTLTVRSHGQRARATRAGEADQQLSFDFRLDPPSGELELQADQDVDIHLLAYESSR
jgi:ubiquinone/menaquinone biosynthesis C-methylase UbiE